MADFKNQFKQFIEAKNLIGITAGVCIGQVTKDAVSSLVNNILFPFH